MMRRPSMPFGERLMRPPADGADAVKNICCAAMNARCLSLSWSKKAMVGDGIAVGQRRAMRCGLWDVECGRVEVIAVSPRALPGERARGLDRLMGVLFLNVMMNDTRDIPTVEGIARNYGT